MAGADRPAKPEIEIAAALDLTGDESGHRSIEGIELAVEEANAAKSAPLIRLVTYDSRSSDDEARLIAHKIVASPAVLVLGPDLSTASLAAGPIYAEAGLASLTPTATSDLITDNRTTFRIIFKNSDQGELLATYVARVLGAKQASVVYADNGYGRSLLEGFTIAARRLGLAAHYFAIARPEETSQVARAVAAEPDNPPVVLLTLDAVGADLLIALRRLGVSGPVLGDDSFGDESFSARLAETPEEQRRRGTLTDGLLAVSPMILDSADAEVQGFARRFRARFGHDPAWFAAAGYDAARAAIETMRAVSPTEAGRDRPRVAALDHLNALNSAANGLNGLLGPIWFDAHHGRHVAIRVGRFEHARFESAPLQIVPVTTPDATELASGAVFEVAPGRFARVQRIVHTGVYVNEISHVDLARSSFGADFYVWLRFARDARGNAADPADLTFPGLLGGGAGLNHPAEQRDMPDGSAYRLWRVQGEFRNDFDLRRYPFDHQELAITFFNSRAAADQIVYVVDRFGSEPSRDRRTPPPAAAATARSAPPPVPEVATRLTSPAAFRNLTQWSPGQALALRDNLVTDSSLGDPSKTGVERYRELSGFRIALGIRRNAVATLAKTLLPLGLMTLIMFASLFFPPHLTKEKVTVAITAALSGAVLLTTINTQLGGIGYTIAIEYAFYVYFALSVLCIVSVLIAEWFRIAGRASTAARTDVLTRVVFILVVAMTLAAGLNVARQPGDEATVTGQSRPPA